MNIFTSQKYSARQLLPFTGNIQIINTPFARALSIDGKNWQIQTICESHQQQWNINTNSDIHRRYIIYGTWNDITGLSRFPIDPTLDVPSENSIHKNLITEIISSIDSIPFPAEDTYEYWLLDNNNYLPIALLATSISKELISETQQIKRWRSRSGSESEFTTSSNTYNRNPFTLLETYINNLSCQPLCAQWFHRNHDGSGTGLQGQNIKQQLYDRVLPSIKFPELLIINQPDNPDYELLLHDYNHWLAPRLLTLHNITYETRLALENAAQYQPADVFRFHRLYPTIINRQLINKTLVEAKLRASLK
ncbi:MAG: hypothetical protein OEY61_10230 [Gammaproteobacteria bacterium]|nr:hypothetical protein [Gammaproteobacteria bacterium]